MFCVVERLLSSAAADRYVSAPMLDSYAKGENLSSKKEFSSLLNPFLDSLRILVDVSEGCAFYHVN